MTATSQARPIEVVSRSEDVPSRVSRIGEVLALIRSGEATTISELASAMRLARSTVTDRVDVLVARGLVRPETGPAAGRGRPAAVYRLDPTAGRILTAQVGMSGLRVGLADLAGNIHATRTSDVHVGEGPAVLLDHLRRGFERLLVQAPAGDREVMGVGVGLPGRIELEATRGLADDDARPWLSHPLRSWLESEYGVPVCVDRGVSLLAGAEHRTFHDEGAVLVGLKVGTVVECGIVVGGHAVAGGSGIAGEIGHTGVPGADQPCVCGNRGCLNAVASGAALVRDLAAAGHDVTTARDVARLAAAGDIAVTTAVRQAGRQIGEVLAGAVNLLNPDVVSVWGYLADGGDHLVAGLREGVYRMAVPAASRHVRIESARLGDQAALRGAATAAIEQALHPGRIDAVMA